MPDLSGFSQIGQSANGVLDRSVGIQSLLIVKVDVIGRGREGLRSGPKDHKPMSYPCTPDPLWELQDLDGRAFVFAFKKFSSVQRFIFE